jgi:error-prone DNA polymerase
VSFVHLHAHTTFSFGDGACRIPELAAAAAGMGMPALAATDHEGLYGAVRFYQACKAAGIKPIVGVELTVEPAVGRDGRVWSPGTDAPAGASPAAPGAFAAPAALTPDGHIRHLAAAATVPPAAAHAAGTGGHHLVLLARDYAGWSNLCRIISAAHLEHPGEPPVARLATLAEHGGHLVALSGCRRGEIWSRLLAGDRAGARAAASVFHEIFGREFFIELQHELLPDSGASLRALDLLAHELRLSTVATNDVHYTVKADAGLHDVLAAEAANQPLPNPLGRKNAELYLKSPAQMRRLFQRYPEAYANAGRIAERCNLDLGLGRLLFPAYPLPPGETAFSLLWKRCFKGAAERYRPLTAEVTARLERELKVVEELGFAEYFLAVHDIVEFARGRGIYYSGRGSAGNSIVSYVLRICDADPIAHGLLFERFLNPARHEMPDVDIDFCSARRDEVIQYIYQRFGHDKVAMVATVNTVRAPSAVRIVSRAFGFTPDEINGLSKRVPWGSAAKLGKMLAERPELADHEFQHPHYRRLVHVAERLSGFPAHLGTHLGGFILSRDPLTDRVPLQWAAKGVVVAQFDKDDVETLGLVKMDILALKMHSAIAEAVRRIEARTGERVRAWELPRDDPEVYRLIRSARTVGLFQLESSGQRNLATRLQERDFEDVIAAISLFRPGPLQADMIAPFIRRRHGREPVTVPHPSMERILRRTYGVIVYQEQVIEVAAAVAGFSLAEGDLLRRTMTHERSLEEMDEIGRSFVEKAVARGVERAAADEVFRQLRGFAAYGFNKAHAACFAIVCNASAWLKAHYPAEFYAGILNNQPMGFYSPRVVLNDARRFGLTVRPLDVNLSGEWFEVEDDGRALRVGLAYVKEMSAAARRAIVEGRGGDGRCRVGGGGGPPAPPPPTPPPPPSPPPPPPPPLRGRFGRRGRPPARRRG